MFDQCVKDFKYFVNEKILGSELYYSQWNFPIQKNVSPKKVGEVKSNNRIYLKLIENSISVIELSVTDEERQVKCNVHINNLLPTLALL